MNHVDHVFLGRDLSRRAVLRSALVCAGVSSLPCWRVSQAQAASSSRSKKRSLILLWQDGGASHFETFDPKPDAPAEYRGELGAIPTTLPGVAFCEVLPRLAQLAHRMCVVRSLHQRSSGHVHACHDDHHATDAYQYPSIEFFRGVAANWWWQGADSLMTFNWSNASPILCQKVGATPDLRRSGRRITKSAPPRRSREKTRCSSSSDGAGIPGPKAIATTTTMRPCHLNCPLTAVFGQCRYASATTSALTPYGLNRWCCDSSCFALRPPTRSTCI